VSLACCIIHMPLASRPDRAVTTEPSAARQTGLSSSTACPASQQISNAAVTATRQQTWLARRAALLLGMQQAG
jgi:hypothetical protein